MENKTASFEKKKNLFDARASFIARGKSISQGQSEGHNS